MEKNKKQFLDMPCNEPHAWVTQNLTEHRIYGIITLLLLKEGTNIK